MTDRKLTEADLLREIGQLMVESPKLQDREWDSVSQIFEFEGSQEYGYGYRYRGTQWSAASSGFPVMDKVLELRARMHETSGKQWQWCRITVVAPEMTTRIDVAYDENPWKMGRKSLDMSDYAMSVRSEHHPDPSAASGDRR